MGASGLIKTKVLEAFGDGERSIYPRATSA